MAIKTSKRNTQRKENLKTKRRAYHWAVGKFQSARYMCRWSLQKRGGRKKIIWKKKIIMGNQAKAHYSQIVQNKWYRENLKSSRKNSYSSYLNIARRIKRWKWQQISVQQQSREETKDQLFKEKETKPHEDNHALVTFIQKTKQNENNLSPLSTKGWCWMVSRLENP